MVQKKLVLLIALLLVIPLVSSAIPVQLNVNQNTGIDIAYPKYDVVKIKTAFDLSFHVSNRTNGKLLTNVTTNCSLHLYGINGNHIYQEDSNFSSNGVDFENSINSSVFSNKGVHAFTITCNSDYLGGFASGIFVVTSTGFLLTQGRAILYIGFISLLVFLFLFTVTGITLLPTEDNKDEYGQLMSINHLKHLRLLLVIVAWVFMLGILFVSSNVALAYLGSTMFGDLLFVLFKIMYALTLPMIVLITIWILVSIFQDKETKKMLERGIETGGSV